MVAGDGLVRCAVKVEPSERMTVCGYRAGTGGGIEGAARRCDLEGHVDVEVVLDRIEGVDGRYELGPAGEARMERRRVGRDIAVVLKSGLLFVRCRVWR